MVRHPRGALERAGRVRRRQRDGHRRGKALIRDALVLCHRLPQVWRRVRTGAVQAWRARRIAQAVLGHPADVCAYVDHEVAPRAQEIGAVGLDRLIDEALVRLYPEQREEEQLAALDARYARLDAGSINHTGVVDFVVRGDWADVSAFDDAVALIAAAMKRDGCTESLDVRRSMAVGILADPARALALLSEESPEPTEPAPASPRSKPSRTRTISLTYHLTEAAIRGRDPLVLDSDGRAHLDQVIREWCGRDDVAITVRPVLDLRDDEGSGHDHDPGHRSYRISDETRAAVALRHPQCVFPFCARPARRSDCDHIVAFDPDDPDRTPTCSRCNLAPLCRHHHRLKTHAGWRYRTVEPGVFVWSDPHGQSFVRDRHGTRDLTPRGVPRGPLSA